MKIHFCSKLAVVFLAAGSACAQAQMVVVAGAASPALPLTTEQVASLFLGQQTKLAGAGIAVLLDQAEGSTLRERFYTKLTGKAPAQVKATWSRLAFSGKGTPPKELAGSAEVKKALLANPNAVGYIERDAVDASVKVLLSVD